MLFSISRVKKRNRWYLIAWDLKFYIVAPDIFSMPSMSFFSIQYVSVYMKPRRKRQIKVRRGSKVTPQWGGGDPEYLNYFPVTLLANSIWQRLPKFGKISKDL
jgi:hypothetical protein